MRRIEGARPARRAVRLYLFAMSFFLVMGRIADASVFLEDQTWTELRDRIKSGATTIIIPIGGVEQSGPAIAVGKHNVRAKFLAEKIAEQLGNAFVAPVVSYVPEGNIDPPTGHMKFPGTISIPVATFEQLLQSAAESFRHQGFKTIVLIGDHGGYQGSEQAVADRLNAQWKGSSARVFADLQYYKITQGAYVDKLQAAGISKSEIGTHAALADTSLMLAVDPSMVRQDRLSGKLGAADGVYGGSPARSSAALGQLGIDLMIKTTTEDIRNFVAKQQTK